jgi:hypothetical protein
MKPVDWVVLMISSLIALVILLPMIHIMVNDLEPNMERGKMMTGLITSLIAILSIYVGAKLRGGDD